MKNKKKTAIGLVFAAVMLVGRFGVVWARTTTYIYYSPAVTAGKWYNGCDHGEVYSLKSEFSQIYGGDVGVYFYESTVSDGMPESFVNTTGRKAWIQLNEQDPDSPSDLVRLYEGHFGTDSKGRYTIVGYSTADTDKGIIETNNVAELYLRIYISTKADDTTRNVPSKLFGYQLWIN